MVDEFQRLDGRRFQEKFGQRQQYGLIGVEQFAVHVQQRRYLVLADEVGPDVCIDGVVQFCVQGAVQSFELGEILSGHAARLMLWEDEPEQRTVQRLAGMGIVVVVFRPQGNRPLDGDFADSMRGNIDRLRSGK